jgi:membrane associated rhomboid family serine protease
MPAGKNNGLGIYDRDYLRDEYEQERRGSPFPAVQSMTVALIIANVALFLLNYLFSPPQNPDDLGWLTEHLSVSNYTIVRPWLWWQFITYGFAHASMGHIFFNMLGLFFLGRTVEEMYGQKEYLRFYLTAILVCSLIWAVGMMIFDPLLVFRVDKPVSILLGASGAVSAVVMLFIFRNPQATLLMFPIPIPIKAWVVGVLMIAGNIYLSFQSPKDGSHIAWSVHLAGIAFAYFYFRGRWNLGNVLQGLRQLPKFLTRPKLRVHQPGDDSEPLDLIEEMDRILDKINRQGESSLTKQERRLLEIASRELRKRRKE